MWMSPVSAWAWTVPGRLACDVDVARARACDDVGRRPLDVHVAGLRAEPQRPADSDGAQVAGARPQLGAALQVLGPQIARTGDHPHAGRPRHLEDRVHAAGVVDDREPSQWSLRRRSAASPLTLTWPPPQIERFSFVVRRTSVRSAATIRTSPVPVWTTIVGAAASVRVWVSVRSVSRPTAFVAPKAKSSTAATMSTTNTGREIPGTSMAPTVGAPPAARQPATRRVPGGVVPTVA